MNNDDSNSGQRNHASFTLNQIAFEHPAQTIRVGLTDQPGTELISIYYPDLPDYARSFFPGCSPSHPLLYMQFGKMTTDVQINVDLTEYPAVAVKYYRWLISGHFINSKAYVSDNFVDDFVVWVHIAKTDKAYQFARYNLKVMTTKGSATPSLRVAYDGNSTIYSDHLLNLDKDHPELISQVNNVIYLRKIYSFKHNLPEIALSNRDKIYPVLNTALRQVLGVATNHTKDLHKHSTYLNKIEWFKDNRLLTKELMELIPLQKQWLPLKNEQVHCLKNTERQYLFGNMIKGTKLQDGLLAHGPYRPIPYQQIRVFFIYHGDDRETRDYLEGYLNAQSGKSRLSEYTKTPTYFDKEMDIVYSQAEHPVPEVSRAIGQFTLSHGTGYLGFYISPYGKFDTQASQHQLYYTIKEMLLQRGIASQTIDKKKVQKAGHNFAFWAPNIAMAAIAKLGVIPWILDRETSNDLVVGFGLYTSVKYKRKFIGSSVCFSNEGKFEEFDYFPEEENFMIAASLEKALMKYLHTHPTVDRLVIHYYKKMSDRDFKPTMEMMDRLSPGIPVVVIKVNSTKSDSTVVRDLGTVHGLPKNGHYFHLGNHQYLLYINEYNEEDQQPGHLPMPVRLGIQCSDRGLLDDPGTIEELIDQVYAFSTLYWRSIRQPAIPVTINYPRMLAENAVWFSRKVIPECATDVPWFL